ncbi:MAG: tail fiber domain-containing protein [Dysgonomonas sp.]|nr:tail fiber domain-containing protein [Dysgonomonas sp.]
MKQLTILLLFLLLICLSQQMTAQVTIGNGNVPHVDAALDIQSEGKRGLLLPRLQLTSKAASSPLSSAMTDLTGILVYNIAAAGTSTPATAVKANTVYYNNGNEWVEIPGVSASLNADNGVELVNVSGTDYVYLGGNALKRHTTITQGGYNLILDNSGSGSLRIKTAGTITAGMVLTASDTNGTVAWTPSANVGKTYTADNGLTMTGTNTRLGGSLKTPTTITADNTNILTLDVNTSGLKITGNGQGANKVLTSNASGVATWQTPTVAGARNGVNNTSSDKYVELGGTLTKSTTITSNNTSYPLILNSTGGYLRILDGGTLTAGHVLTSDAAGNATWQAPQGGSSSSYSTVKGANGLNATPTTTGQSQYTVKLGGTLDAATTITGTATNTLALQGANMLKITDGNQALNKILVSDANGVASWKTVPVRNGLSISTTGNYVELGGTLTKATTITQEAQNFTINTGTGIFQIDNTKGKFQIIDGQQGLDKVLASDADGNTIWSDPDWKITGNSNITEGTHFLGTTNDVPLQFRVNKLHSGYVSSNGNTALGYLSMPLATTGKYNTAMGYQALANASFTGTHNIAMGYQAMQNADAGLSNVAIGRNTLTKVNNGAYNIATGGYALNALEMGYRNIGMGYLSMYKLTSGSSNVAIGEETLRNVIQGNSNVAIGTYAMYGTVSASGGAELDITNNIAIGYEAMKGKNTGPLSKNVAIGNQAMSQLAKGEHNVAIGVSALKRLGTGSGNISIVTEPHEIELVGTEDFSNTLRIGYWIYGDMQELTAQNKRFCTYINQNPQHGHWHQPTSEVTLVVNGTIRANGNLVTTSDRRLKTNINNLGYGLKQVMQLRPVSYMLKDDAENKTQVGFIAQEVKPIIPEVVNGVEGDMEKGETLGVSYSEFTPVLTKAIQEQQVIIESQQQTIDKQQQTIDALLKRVEALEKK